MPDNTLTAEFCLAILDRKEKLITTILSDPNLDVNKKTKAGFSPIYYAVIRGNKTIVDELIKLGANLHETYDGLTLLDIVREQIKIAEEIKSDDPHFDYLKKMLPQFKEIEKTLKSKNVKSNEKIIDQVLNLFGLNKYKEIGQAQRFIQTPLKELKYTLHSPGYCNGVAYGGIQALLDEKRDDKQELMQLKKFDDHFSYLYRYQGITFKRIFNLMHHKRLLLTEIATVLNEESKTPKRDKEKQEWLELVMQDLLKDEEKQILELRPFLETIYLFQDKNKHKKIFPDEIPIIQALPLLETAALEEKGGLAVVDHFTAVGFTELNSILLALKRLAQENKYDGVVAIHLSANRHAVDVAFDSIKNEWILINANMNKSTVMHFLSEEKFLEALAAFLTFNNKPNKGNAIIQANIFSTMERYEELNEKILTPLKQTKEWDDMLKVTHTKLNYIDQEYETWFYRASDNEDEFIVKKIKEFREHDLDSVLYGQTVPDIKQTDKKAHFLKERFAQWQTKNASSKQEI